MSAEDDSAGLRPSRALLALARASTARPGRVAVALLVIAALGIWGARRVSLSTDATALLAGRSDRGALAALALHSGALGGDRELVLLVSAALPGRARRAAHTIWRQLAAAPFVDGHARVDGEAIAALVRRHALTLVPRRRFVELSRALTTARRRRVEALRRALLAPVGPDPRAVARDPLGLAALVFDPAMARQGALALSDDGRHALLVLRLRRRGGDLEQAAAIALAVETVRARWAARGVAVRATGAPVYARDVARSIERDLSRSALLGLALATIALLALLRWWPLLLAAPLSAGLAVLCVLAFAALVQIELSALSLAFAAICIGLGVDAVVHLAASARGARDDAETLARFEALAPALGASTLTTLAAFGALALASFAGLAQTGLLAAAGLLLSMLFALLIVPPLVRLRRPRAAKATRDPLGARLARALAARAGPITLVVGALLVGSLLVASQLHVDGDLASLAPHDTAAERTDRAIARAFARARHRLIVIARGATLEHALAANDAAAAALGAPDRRADVAALSSLAPLLPSRATQRRRVDRLAALAPRRVASALRRDLERAGFGSAAFEPFFAQLRSPRPIDATRPPPALQPLLRRLVGRDRLGRHLVASYVVARDGGGAARLAAQLRQLARRDKLDLLVTSAPLASAALARTLRRDLLIVVGATLVAVLVALVVLLRSAHAVLAALVSLAVSGALFCALLALAGLSIDLYTALLAPLLLGYGVDDHIYIARAALREGMTAAFARSGRAVITTTATSVAAIGALLICQTAGLRRLAISASIGLTVTMLCALFVLPALLALGGRELRR